MQISEVKTRITELLDTRSTAIQENNTELFLSTQRDEIVGSFSGSYISTDAIVHTLLSCHADKNRPDRYVALIEEEYYFQEELSHIGYLLYYFKKNENGNFFIEDIRY